MAEIDKAFAGTWRYGGYEGGFVDCKICSMNVLFSM